MIDLVCTGRDPTDLAREFEPSRQAIRNWVAETALTTAEREELLRLRRENKQLRLERDILGVSHSKIASLEPRRAPIALARGTRAWFARETGAVPSGSSSS